VLKDQDLRELYKKTHTGQIPEFAGISASYEVPENPQVHMVASKMDVQECADAVIQYLEEQEIIPS